MKFNEQDRQEVVILSAAKDLGAQWVRSKARAPDDLFDALLTLLPILVVKNHNVDAIQTVTFKKT